MPELCESSFPGKVILLAVTYFLQYHFLSCLFFLQSDSWLAVWLSGDTLPSINVVALRQTRLVLGWVTVCGRVNHLGI